MVSSREISIIPIIAGAIVVIVITFFVVVISNSNTKNVVVRIGSGIYKADIASDEESRQKGLSGLPNLEVDRALLMIFPDSQKWGIWMKDMEFPIDILWLDENKVVVHAVANANPSISDSKTFTPKSPAKYVIELPAGSIKNKSIVVGSIAAFEISPVIGVK